MGAGMALTPRRGLLAALSALVLLASCGSQQTERVISIDLLRNILRRPAPVAQVSLGAIQNAVSKTSEPLELAVREDEKGWAFYVAIGSNAGFDTYGNDQRQTMTLRRGIVTATRGLGDDLMSSDISQTAALIAARRAGQGTRIMRFLDGEDQTREIVMTCSVTRGDAAPVALGEVNTTATAMTETCRSGSRTITNTFLVDASGRSLGSRQWLSEMNGYMLFQTLRR